MLWPELNSSTYASSESVLSAPAVPISLGIASRPTASPRRCANSQLAPFASRTPKRIQYQPIELNSRLRAPARQNGERSSKSLPRSTLARIPGEHVAGGLDIKGRPSLCTNRLVAFVSGRYRLTENVAPIVTK